MPGVIVIARDGRVVYRQVATAKDDRVSTPDLVAILDDRFGTHGPAAVRVTPLDSTQLRVELGGALDIRAQAHGVAAASVLLPIGAHLLVGPWLGIDTRLDHVDLAGAALFRVPLLGDAGAFELGVIAGWATGWDSVTLAVRADLWFAMSPTTAFDLGAAFETRTEVRDTSITFGVSRLLGGARRARR